jgi:hypothetical protein
MQLMHKEILVHVRNWKGDKFRSHIGKWLIWKKSKTARDCGQKNIVWGGWVSENLT